MKLRGSGWTHIQKQSKYRQLAFGSAQLFCCWKSDSFSQAWASDCYLKSGSSPVSRCPPQTVSAPWGSGQTWLTRYPEIMTEGVCLGGDKEAGLVRMGLFPAADENFGCSFLHYLPGLDWTAGCCFSHLRYPRSELGLYKYCARKTKYFCTLKQENR